MNDCHRRLCEYEYYTVLCTLCSVHCALYTVLFTLCSLHCALYTVLCTLRSLHCALYTVRFTLCAQCMYLEEKVDDDLHGLADHFSEGPNVGCFEVMARFH